MSRVLAIDYGKKRTGLAWTDPLKLSLNPLPTIATEGFRDRVAELIASDQVGTIVFGLPAHKDGVLTKIGETVLKLVNEFQKKYPQLNIVTVDESFTSVRAKELLLQMGVKKSKRREKGTVDQMSAVLILKEYLNI